MIKQKIIFKRKDNDLNIRILSGEIKLSKSGTMLDFSAQLPSKADAENFMAEPVEVFLSINGYTFSFVIDSISENYTWGKGTYSISGMSPSVVFTGEYSPKITKVFTGTTAKQIVLEQLQDTGWNLDWQLPEFQWNINGEYSVVDKTKMEIMCDVAKALGGIVQTHNSEKKIIIKSRFPVAPADFAEQEPDEFLNQGILSIGKNYEKASGYNAIIASGTDSGSVVDVRLSGTAGDKYAPEIAEGLLTNTLAAVERGRVELNRCAYNKTIHDILIPLPEADSGKRPKLLFPCDMVQLYQYQNNPVDNIRGLVSENSIAFQGAKTRQKIKLEQYHVEPV